MKIGILTSSRADYGIYKSLLLKLKEDNRFSLEIICFGMHLQKSKGFTINEIKNDKYQVIHELGKIPNRDSIKSISYNYGKITSEFSKFWGDNKFDLVFAIGDRWEMSAAVQSSIPFEIQIAHIHGGETTIGSVDNIYRHQITLASKIHFTTSKEHSKKVSNLIGNQKDIFNVGSLSLENIDLNKLPTWKEVKHKFNIPFDKFILVTFHPETISSNQNFNYSLILFDALLKISKDTNIVITNTNSDANSSLFNKQYKNLLKRSKNFKLINSFGKENYFSAIKNCSFMLGNTSSGIIESASFKKWVINVGNRQKGRVRNENVIDTDFSVESILKAIENIKTKKEFNGVNQFYKPNTSDLIINSIIKFQNG